jgi:HEAT repeats
MQHEENTPIPDTRAEATNSIPDLSILQQAVLRRIALAQKHTASATVEELVEQLAHPEWQIRAMAVHKLSDLGVEAPLDHLLHALDDTHSSVRAAAVYALGKSGQRVPLTYLERALQDDDWHVREVARQTLEQCSANSAGEHISAWSPARMILHFWLVLSRQVSLIHVSVWWITALLITLSTALSLYLVKVAPGLAYDAEVELALVIAIVTSASVAFVCDTRHDDCQEILLSTPTSLQLLLCCRMLLMLSYCMLLALLASALIAIVQGGDMHALLLLWLGPAILLSSFSLLLAQLVGTLFAIGGVLVLEILQMMQIHFIEGSITLTHNYLWQTNPLMLFIAIVLFIGALLYASRHPRFA